MNASMTLETLESRALCSAAPLGVNLVVNGDFEASVGETTSQTAHATDVPGWYTGHGATVAMAYGTPGFPTSAQGAPNGGKNFLSGVYHPAISYFLSEASQTIDISSLAADVDAGRLRSDFGADLGGFGREADTMSAGARFLGADNSFLGSSKIDGPSAADRGNLTGFRHVAASAAVPAGTRSVELEFFASLRDGMVADGYADNVSFKLSSTASKSTGFVAGTVYNDLSGDGARNENEKGLAGVTVWADLNNNRKLDKDEPRAVSGATGKYEIAGVRPGTVRIRQLTPKTFRATTGVRTVRVSGGSAATSSNVDLGDSQTVLITGNVFADNDANGKQGVGEGGFAGLSVSLEPVGVAKPVLVKLITTDDNGNFSFVEQPGTYTIKFVGADGVKQSTPARNHGFTITLAKGQTSAGNVFGATRI